MHEAGTVCTRRVTRARLRIDSLVPWFIDSLVHQIQLCAVSFVSFHWHLSKHLLCRPLISYSHALKKGCANPNRCIIVIMCIHQLQFMCIKIGFICLGHLGPPMAKMELRQVAEHAARAFRRPMPPPDGTSRNNMQRGN